VLILASRMLRASILFETWAGPGAGKAKVHVLNKTVRRMRSMLGAENVMFAVVSNVWGE
jgi:hypothetical protein